jgi:hypothetical protein
VIAGRAVRFDMLERLEDELEQSAKAGTGVNLLRPKLVSLLGCSNETLAGVLAELGWQEVEVEASEGQPAPTKVFRLLAHTPGNRKQKRARRERVTVRPDSPFAGLAKLMAK